MGVCPMFASDSAIYSNKHTKHTPLTPHVKIVVLGIQTPMALYYQNRN